MLNYISLGLVSTLESLEWAGPVKEDLSVDNILGQELVRLLLHGDDQILRMSNPADLHFTQTMTNLTILIP